MKFNEKILGWGVIVVILVIWALSYKFSWVIYILYISIIIGMPFLVVNEIISIRRSNYSKERKLVIEVPYYGHLIWLLYMFNIIMHMDRVTTIELVLDIFIIVIGIIDLPINYKNNSKIYFFKDGIFIARILKKKIIPYSQIEKLKFIEYLKGRFLLDIQLEKSVVTEAHQYKIKEKDKEDIILFVNGFIDKEKINETKEYKEDKLW